MAWKCNPITPKNLRLFSRKNASLTKTKTPSLSFFSLGYKWREVLQTWTQHAVDGPLFIFRCGPACLTRWTGVGCGGWWVGFWWKLWRRVSICYQDLGGTQETDAVQAWQDHRLFNYFLTHGAMQLMLQALHVRLLEANKQRMTICTWCCREKQAEYPDILKMIVFRNAAHRRLTAQKKL